MSCTYARTTQHLPQGGGQGLGPVIPPAPKGIEYAQPQPEPLPTDARNVLDKYFPGLDLSKVRVQIDKQMAPNRGMLAYVSPAAKIGAINTIHIRPGAYLYYAFNRAGVGEIGLGYPDASRFSDRALGLGLLAHEITHIAQAQAYMQQYGDQVGRALWAVQYGYERQQAQGGWGPMEIGARAIAAIVATDIQSASGE